MWGQGQGSPGAILEAAHCAPLPALFSLSHCLLTTSGCAVLIKRTGDHVPLFSVSPGVGNGLTSCQDIRLDVLLVQMGDPEALVGLAKRPSQEANY